MSVALNGEEARRFDGRVAELAEDAFAFLELLVAHDSTLGREQQAQSIVADELAALGFEVSELNIPDSIGEHAAAGVPQLSYAGRHDVLGRWQGSEPVLLFNGHVDVVPADAATWSGDPFTPRRVDGWLLGRGAGDMKGGFAMVLLALRALASSVPSALDVPIGFLSVIEEECTGNGTLASVLAGVGAPAGRAARALRPGSAARRCRRAVGRRRARGEWWPRACRRSPADTGRCAPR